ncbi:c-type cytochrome [Rubrimonas sp.]|uniref:c-type cytochrome n=1 Tax=Rubrimonas sp. TaxID=2036015 RepID=UPI002FDD33FF
MRRPLLAFLALAALAACGEDRPTIDVAAAERGARVFEVKCSACHASSDAARVGPGMRDVHGAPAAAAADFPYSDALRAAGIVWDDEALVALLTQGEDWLPGINMIIEPLPETEARDVAEHLKRLSGGGRRP